MGIWDDITSAVSDLGEGVANVAVSVGNGVADAAVVVGNGVADAAVVVGNGVADAAVVVGNGVVDAGKTVYGAANDGIDYVNKTYDELVHSENEVHIANNMDEDLLVLVTPNSDWVFTDLGALVGKVALSAALTVVSEGAATPTLWSSLQDLYSGLSLLKDAYDITDQSIDLAKMKAAENNINAIIDYLKDKDAITIKPGEVVSVCKRNIANPFGYLNPSQWASLSSASDKTIFITTASCSRQVHFHTNSDYSWVVNKNNVVRAKKGTLRQQDESLGIYPFSIGSRLIVGHSLSLGESIAAKDQSSFLVLQHDGNLVIYENEKPHIGKAIWDSGTKGKDVKKFVATPHELYLETGDGSKIWTQAVSSECTNLFMQEDKNCVFYNSKSVPFWASQSDPHKK